jgi:hypothetical protein
VHSHWALLWHEIDRDDVVILGGGGMLDNSDALNVVIIEIQSKCDDAIIWGGWKHKYCEDNAFNMKPTTTPIDFQRVALGGIRDNNHPYGMQFLPCTSNMHQVFFADKKSMLERFKEHLKVVLR